MAAGLLPSVVNICVGYKSQVSSDAMESTKHNWGRACTWSLEKGVCGLALSSKRCLPFTSSTGGSVTYHRRKRGLSIIVTGTSYELWSTLLIYYRFMEPSGPLLQTLWVPYKYIHIHVYMGRHGCGTFVLHAIWLDYGTSRADTRGRERERDTKDNYTHNYIN